MLAYGYIYNKATQKTAYAHRMAYETKNGPIPDGLQIDHLCRNRTCVNPDHLAAVPPGKNKSRQERAYRTHCPRGHEFTPENTYWKNRPQRGRECLRCARENARRRQREQNRGPRP